MKNKIPGKLLKTKYRKDMWEESEKIIQKLDKVISISSIHLLGSFTTKKKRPGDVDVIAVIKTKDDKNKKWSIDFQFVPDNQYGELVLSDCKKWMKQKYGAKNSGFIKIK